MSIAPVDAKGVFALHAERQRIVPVLVADDARVRDDLPASVDRDVQVIILVGVQRRASKVERIIPATHPGLFQVRRQFGLSQHACVEHVIGHGGANRLRAGIKFESAR